MVIFEGRKERNVLFNDGFQMFYLLSHGVGHMVKDHSYIEIVNLLLPLHGLLFLISSKGSFICTFHRQDSTYHGLWYTNCGAQAGMRNSSVCQP